MSTGNQKQTACELWLHEALHTTEALLIREKTSDLAHETTLLAGRLEELLCRRDVLKRDKLRLLARNKAFWQDVHAVIDSLHRKLQLAETMGQPTGKAGSRLKRWLTESSRRIPTGSQLKKLLTMVDPLADQVEYADWIFLLAELHLEIELQESTLLELQLKDAELQADASIVCTEASEVFESTHATLRTRFFGEPGFVESFFLSKSPPRVRARQDI